MLAEIRAEPEPQEFYHRKAKEVRAGRIDGVVHLYRQSDVVAANQHRAVLGKGGRGSILGSTSALIPLELDGADDQSGAGF